MIHLYFKASNPFSLSENAYITPPVSNEDYSVGHVIDKATSSSAEGERAKITRFVDLKIVLLSFVAFLVYLMMFATVSRQLYPRLNFKLQLRFLCLTKPGKPFPIRLSVYGLNVFCFLVSQILVNNVKVSFI